MKKERQMRRKQKELNKPKKTPNNSRTKKKKKVEMITVKFVINTQLSASDEI